PNFFAKIHRGIACIGINLIGIVYPALLMVGYKSSVCIYLAAIIIVYAWKNWSNVSNSSLAFLNKILQWRLFIFMGNVSYGVYLLHGFVFFCLNRYVFPRWSLWTELSLE